MRELAIRILTRVLSDHQPVDEALAEGIEAGDVGAGSLDRAWLQEVCYGTLRWKGRLDHILDSTSLKKKPTGWLRKALLIASYQLVVQDRTSSAKIVSETVDLVRKREGEAPAKFANAILRNISAHAPEWRELSAPSPDASDDSYIARLASLPPWLWKKLVTQYGLSWAWEYSVASLERPSLWIREKSGQAKQVEGGVVSARPGFSEGEFIVQDISNQTIIAEVSAEIERLQFKVPGRGTAISALDLCAAPGGKTAALAWNGFAVTATDKSEKRMELLRNTVGRTNCGAKTIAFDEVEALPLQDLVWVDAPCSGTGVLRRQPDIRWLRREEELCALVDTQRELVGVACKKLRPGGYLVYSVCSVLKEEGPDLFKSLGASLVANNGAEKIREWFCEPQSSPFGDGFWAVMLRINGAR